MRKIIVSFIVLIMIGVVVTGSGSSIMVFNPQQILEGRQIGYISYGSVGNASFIAPMPINYTLNVVYSPGYYLTLLLSRLN